MSQGLGWLQCWLLYRLVAENPAKAVTFDEILMSIRQSWGVNDPGNKELIGPSLKRSLRRALQRLVETEHVVAIGDGGRGDPFRYCVHPLVLASGAGTKEAYEQAFAAVSAIPAAVLPLSSSLSAATPKSGALMRYAMPKMRTLL